MGSLDAWIPDLKYREFMLQLSRQITSQDMEELKYILASRIPDGIMESLDTALELFRHLERRLFVGPNNLCSLKELFGVMKKQTFCDILLTELKERARYVLKARVYP